MPRSRRIVSQIADPETQREIANLTQRFLNERIRPIQDFVAAAGADPTTLMNILSAAPSRPRGRHLNMPRRIRTRSREVEESDSTGMKRTPMGGFGKKIYAWPVVGSTEVSGMHAKYTVILWSTGEMSCDCAGWINYHKKKGELACKHVKERKDSGTTIFQMWRRHETLPTATQAHDEGVVVQNAVDPSRPINTVRPASGLLLGRVIDL